MVLQLPEKNREVVASGWRWSTVAGGCGGSGCSRERERTRERPRERESDRERREMEGARSRGGCTGRRWSMVAGGCGGSGCSGERERARERATKRDAKWRALTRVVVALARGGRRWPEGVVVVGAVERESERSCRGAGAGKKKGSRISNPK